jgi:hypothetical protein
MILIQLVKKFFASYGNQNYAPVITVTYPAPFEIQSILFLRISSRNIVLASVPQSPSLPFIYWTVIWHGVVCPCLILVPFISFTSTWSRSSIGEDYEPWSFAVCRHSQFSTYSVTFFLLSSLFSDTLSLLLGWETKFYTRIKRVKF